MVIIVPFFWRSGRASEIYKHITEEVRNFLFEPDTRREELDLAAFNIRRGRDHGVPASNKLRRSVRLPPFRSFN